MLLLGLVAFGAIWASFIDKDEVVRTGTGFFYLDLFTTTSGVPISLLVFISTFGPIIGITLGFDSINGERTQGTLSRVLAQPVYRDAVYNGKFLAGLLTLSLVLVSMGISAVGVALFRFGIPPGGDEMLRLIGFALVGIAYLSFWLALAMTASIFLRNAVASALVSIGIWIGASFFIVLAASTIAERVVPEVTTIEEASQQFSVELWVSRASPTELFSEATGILLNPITGRVLNPFAAFERGAEGIDPNAPVSAGQSLQLVWPHIVVLVGMVAILLAISYVRFMREEIRA